MKPIPGVAATGWPLRSYGDREVDSIGFATPFIHYTCALDGDRLPIVTRMGDEARVHTVGPITGARAQRLGGGSSSRSRLARRRQDWRSRLARVQPQLPRYGDTVYSDRDDRSVGARSPPG